MKHALNQMQYRFAVIYGPSCIHLTLPNFFKVFIEFSASMECQKAQHALTGRKFSNRKTLPFFTYARLGSMQEYLLVVLRVWNSAQVNIQYFAGMWIRHFFHGFGSGSAEKKFRIRPEIEKKKKIYLYFR